MSPSMAAWPHCSSPTRRADLRMPKQSAARGPVENAARALRAQIAELRHLDQTIGLLDWDEETMLPPAGRPQRGEQLATLEGLRHGLLVSDRLGDLVEEVAGAGAGDERWEREIALLRRLRRRAIGFAGGSGAGLRDGSTPLPSSAPGRRPGSTTTSGISSARRPLRPAAWPGPRARPGSGPSRAGGPIDALLHPTNILEPRHDALPPRPGCWGAARRSPGAPGAAGAASADAACTSPAAASPRAGNGNSAGSSSAISGLISSAAGLEFRSTHPFTLGRATWPEDDVRS